MTNTPKIIYTEIDEAPRLATYSLLPIIKAFTDTAGVAVEMRDISLATRVIASFPERLTDAQKIPDHLAELGRMTQDPGANIIKLPNVSASTPQLHAVIKELQAKGYDLPNYPDEPQNDAEKAIKVTYDKIKGSAVNPVLREGNSDRRAAKAVKEYAQKHPHTMGAWSKDSLSHVSHMSQGDFYGTEKSVVMAQDDTLKIEFVGADNQATQLGKNIQVEAGEVVDGAYMSRTALCQFYAEQIKDAKAKGVLWSLHLKATMMKISDPIMFGHAVRAYYEPALNKHAAVFEELHFDANNGIGDAYDKIKSLPADQSALIKADLDACLTEGPDLAMVDSSRGITNLHVPSDVIIDASMPPMIRDSGRMWNKDNELQDVKAVIPDSTYAGIYDVTVRDCQAHGKLDPAIMGSVPNVGLMAQKAEEYGSHDKTFEMASAGTVRIVDSSGAVLLSHDVEQGDIWRACQTKDIAIRDWVKLAVRRGHATGVPVIFWLDSTRGHDAEVIAKVEKYLVDEDTDGLEIQILTPEDAMQLSLDRIRRGEDTISVTGNVLRDYLTDLFPILEIGTSARMLSVVPLLNGGGLFETGAGGSAPKHVQQFQQEGHLRWDSLGEYMALAASLEHLSEQFDNVGAGVLGNALDAATGQYLQNGRIPSRKVNEMDNRGSTFYLTLYWAQALASQSDDADIAKRFGLVASAMAENEAKIIAELDASQGSAMELGGYYKGDLELLTAAMCPSETLNSILEGV